MNEHTDSGAAYIDAVVVEDTVYFTLDTLCQACQTDREQLTVLVREGVLDPGGSGPEDWQFSGASLRREAEPPASRRRGFTGPARKQRLPMNPNQAATSAHAPSK